MLSVKSLRYLNDLFKQSHRTYQFPLVWNRKKKKFILDSSKRYAQLSNLLLLIDSFAFIMTLGMAILNHKSGLSYSFTLLLLFFLGPTFENIILDVHAVFFKETAQQFLNTLWRLIVLGRQGNKISTFKLAPSVPFSRI